MKRKMVICLALVGLFFILVGLKPDFIKEKKEKIPKGLKTKTEIGYEIEEKFGKTEKIEAGKTITKYNDKGNQVEFAEYGGILQPVSTRLAIPLFPDRGNHLVHYRLKQFAGSGCVFNDDNGHCAKSTIKHVKFFML